MNNKNTSLLPLPYFCRAVELKRWNDVEENGLREIHRLLDNELQSVAQNPEVVGDRKLLRFFRGHNYDVAKACEMLSKFLSWRKTCNIDEIRDKIVYGGVDHPLKFPHGEKVFSLMAQIVIDTEICDKTGAPICVEQYNFSPTEVLQKIKIEEYIEFITYALEYKSVILEQLSHEKEVLNYSRLQSHISQYADTSIEQIPKDILNELDTPYGVIMHTCVIRDLSGVGWEHLGAQGQDIIRAVIGNRLKKYF